MPLARLEKTEDTETVFETRIFEFLEHFFEASTDRVFQQIMIQAAPTLTGDALVDGMIAAVGEHLSLSIGLVVPCWVHEPKRMGPPTPVRREYVSRMFPEIRDTPLAFRKRNIFILR